MCAYNLFLVVLHMIGTLICAAWSFCKVIWLLDWRWNEETYVWTCFLLVYFVHYLIIDWGQRKKLLHIRTLIVLKYWEIIIWGLLGLVYSGVFAVSVLKNDMNVEETLLLFVPFVLIMFVIFFMRRKVINKIEKV